MKTAKKALILRCCIYGSPQGPDLMARTFSDLFYHVFGSLLLHLQKENIWEAKTWNKSILFLK